MPSTCERPRRRRPGPAELPQKLWPPGRRHRATASMRRERGPRLGPAAALASSSCPKEGAMNGISAAIERRGFRKWYEGELVRGHAQLVLLVLATLAALGA